MSTSPSPAADGEAGAARDRSEAQLLRDHDVLWLRASNPGPLTLSGTNTWVVGREPTWVVDPGPLDEEHLTRLRAAIDGRGGLGGVVLTHDHHDHSEAAGALVESHPAPLGAGR